MEIAGVIENKYYAMNHEINEGIATFIGMKQDKFNKIVKEKDYNYACLYDMSPSEMASTGFSKKQAERLEKLIKLSTGLFRKTKSEELQINSPSTIAAYYMHMKYNAVEELKLICIDTKYNIIAEEILSVGTVNASLVHPREVFITALKHKATSVIMLHNHPSGNPAPSPEDIAITTRVKEAGEIVGINLLDHIIIGDGSYNSLKERGYM